MKRLLLIPVIILLFSSTVTAAPHITRSIPEPPELPGRSLQVRFPRNIPEGIPSAAPLSYTTPQTVNVLFLRVEFQPDQDPSTTGSGAWNDPLYTYNNDSDYWVNQAKTRFPNYWKEVSYGLLAVKIDISPKVYLLPHPMTYYAGRIATSIQNYIYDSVTTASTDTTLNFALYDGVFIVHAGVGQETDTTGAASNDLWSLFYSGGSSICRDAGTASCVTTTLKDGMPLSEAIIMPQTDVRTNVLVDALGVYVHEFGHWLGLPDLYCALPSGCVVEGVGNWSLMDEGSYNADPATCTPNAPHCIRGSAPAHPDAWSLVKLGWVNPRAITAYQSISLDPVESTSLPAAPATGTNVLLATASTGTSHQYFLIENRQMIGFDSGLPGHGLLVWLIDDDVVIPGLSSNTVNSGAHPGVKLIEADGHWSLQKPSPSDFGSPGDPFPGSTANMNLTPMTNPSSTSYTDYGWVNIRHITEPSLLVTFFIGFAPLPPAGLTVNADTKTLSWGASAGAVDYYIYKNGLRTRLGSTGSALSFVDGNFLNTDFYEVTAVDANGNESQAATLGVPPTGPGAHTSSGNAGGSGSKRCFIATAAYGSSLDPHVESLRSFRDRFLLTNPVGRVFVAFYYHYSPPIADIIRRHEKLRTITRWVLTPVVFTTEYPVISLLFFATAVLLAGRKIFTLRP